MSPRARVPIHIAVALIATLGIRSACAEEATPAPSFDPLLGHRRVLVETNDGRLLRVRPVGVTADSLLFDRPRARLRAERIEYARGDVARAWVPKRNPGTMALMHALTGFAGGALVELGMGSPHQGLGIDARNVLGGGLVSGVSHGYLGLLVGILWPGWKQAVPALGPDGEGEVKPFPAWSATATGGVVSPSQLGGEGRSTSASIDGWKNTGRHWSWGFEYGVLAHEGGRSVYPAYTFTDTATGLTYHTDA